MNRFLRGYLCSAETIRAITNGEIIIRAIFRSLIKSKEPDPEPNHLVVYRDRDERVKFLEINAVTQRLIQVLKENPEWRGLDAVSQIARELQHPSPEGLYQAGRELLEQLRQRHVILGTRAA